MKKPETRPAEIALLRAVFSPLMAKQVAHGVTIRQFHYEDTRAVFTAFRALLFAGEPVLPQSVELEVTARGMDQAHAAALVGAIMEYPEPKDVTYLLRGLRSLSTRRWLAEVLEEVERPENLSGDMGGAVAKINEFLLGYHSASEGTGSVTMTEVLDRVLKREGPQKVWTPGLGVIDNYWKIRKASYTVLGGDSGSGKTALAVNLALNLARQQTHIGVISIEMTADELVFRAAAIEAGVDHDKVEDNRLSQSELDAILWTIEKNKEVYDRIHVLDPSSVSAEQLPGMYNDLIAKHGCEIVIVDYLQRIRTSEKTVHNKTDQVAHASETITAITKSTGVATIALSVLSRGEGGKKKGLENLKHSGQIGHDAHTVVILTPEVDDGYSEYKYIVVEAVKNRKGRFFAERLELHGPTQRMKYADSGPAPQEEQKPVAQF